MRAVTITTSSSPIVSTARYASDIDDGFSSHPPRGRVWYDRHGQPSETGTGAPDVSAASALLAAPRGHVPGISDITAALILLRHENNHTI